MAIKKPLAAIFSTLVLLASHSVALGKTPQAPENPSGEERASQGEAATKKRVTAKYRAEARVSYLSNIFRLTEAQILDMQNPGPADLSSGRYNSMNEPSDYLYRAAFRVELAAKGVGPFERVEVSPEVAYNRYHFNPAASHPQLGLDIGGDLNRRLALDLSAAYLHGAFRKNYLWGYIDANQDANISGSERLYKEGIYSDLDMAFSLAVEVIDRGKSARIFRELQLIPLLELHRRLYEAPFENRSRKALYYGLSAELELSRSLDLALGYSQGKNGNPGESEATLIDENLAGYDVVRTLFAWGLTNNAPLQQPVDRSRLERRLQLSLDFTPWKKWNFSAAYTLRSLAYLTQAPLNQSYYKRSQLRTTWELGVAFEPSKSLSLEARAEDAWYSDDSLGGLDKYNQRSLTLRARYEF